MRGGRLIARNRRVGWASSDQRIEVDKNVIKSRVRNLVSLAASVALPLGLGGLGAVATTKAIPEWYANLAKPSWNPPPQVFGPVWTVLYTAMGLAAWLVWRRGTEASPSRERTQVRGALTVYAAQLALNAIWSPIFFGMKRIDLALAVIIAMFVLIAETMRRFYRARPVAAALLVPYLAWVAFATVLNWSIWRLNRG